MHPEGKSRPGRPPRGPRRDDRSLTADSFAVRADALRVLEEHRAAMARGRALVKRSLELCAVLDEWLAPPAARRPGARERPAPARPEPRCTHARCGEPAAFHPCFVFGAGEHRVTLRTLPTHVCARHRAELDALFRRPEIVETLRSKLRARGRSVPGPVRVVFEVLT